MTTTVTPSDLNEIAYRREYWREYVRESGFKPYMGTTPTSIIQTLYEATRSGKSIGIPLVSRLKGSGVEGSTRLSGSEEGLGKHTHFVSVKFRRNAVELDKEQEHYDFSNARNAVRPLLKEWSMDKLRSDIIDALFSTVSDGVSVKTVHAPLNSQRNAAASSGEATTWLTANQDRVLFGNSTANFSTTLATALATIDNSGYGAAGDKFGTASISLMKRLAKRADPHIRPIRLDDGSGREFYMIFAHSLCFRDLSEDTAMQNANRDARAREGKAMDDNPLFQGGDLIWDGCIIREIPEIPTIASSINVGGVALCGAQAIACAYGQEPRFVAKKEDDYDFFTGVGIEEMIGVNKIQRKDGVTGSKIDNGIVTGFFAAVGV